MRVGAILAALFLGLSADRGEAAPPSASLYIDCRGETSAAPTVVLESGAFGGSADWDKVIDDLARRGRVCAYDRSGIGRSPARTGEEGPEAIARELGGLLDSLGENRPVILVGHSNGALYVEAFAALWPRRTAGLVYVNGVTSDDLDYPALIDDLTNERRLSDLAVVASDFNLGPVVADILTQPLGLDEDGARRKRDSISSPGQVRVARDEDRAIIPGLSEVRRLGGSPPAVPTAVIVGSTAPDAPLAQAWHAAESAVAARAKLGWVLDAPGATHTSPLVRDRAYVVAAVDWLRSLPQPPVQTASVTAAGR